MKYILKRWEVFVNSTINPDAFGDHQPDAAQRESFVKESGSERDIVYAGLKEEATVHGSNKKMGFFIRTHQAGLIRLMDKVQSYINRSTGPMFNVYVDIQRHLHFIFGYLEENFFRYFDFMETVPCEEMPVYKHRMEKDVLSLEFILTGNPNLDENISKVISKHFRDFIENKVPATFKDIKYNEQLLKGLLSLLRKEHGNSCEPLLEVYMIAKNFNSRDYIDYLTSRLDKELNEMTDTDTKRLHLLHLRKTIKQVPVENVAPAVDTMPPLQTHLVKWIDEELDYLETAASGNANIIGQGKPYQMKFNTTVKVLALIGRAFFDTKLIVNHNKKETFENLASHISTVGSDSVSYKVLIKRGSSPEEKDKEAAKDIVMKLFDQIRKY